MQLSSDITTVRDPRGKVPQETERLRCSECRRERTNQILIDEVKIRTSVKLKAKQPGRKNPTVETEVRGTHEHRFSRVPSGAIQLAWDEGKFTHIHCKLCDNSWKAKNGVGYDDRFEVSKDEKGIYTIKCKNCGRSYSSG